MPPFTSVLAAVDPGNLAERVIRHAAGLAGAAGARLALVTVTPTPGRAVEEQLEQLYNAAVPYGATYIKDPRFITVSGPTVDAILSEGAAADLIVSGTHGREGLARLLLGSTSTSLLERSTKPVLLVPPTDYDIVTLDFNAVGLNFTSVVAAVDLAEASGVQMRMAAAMAALAKRQWLCLTVVGPGMSEHDAAAALRAAAKGIEPHPTAFIVRRGDVPEEIARGAGQEQSGLVVMGLRMEGRGRPGRVATAVAKTGRALVLAVPQ